MSPRARSLELTATAALRAAMAPWRLPRGALLDRAADVLTGSMVLVGVSTACMGAAMADQAARQALRLLGDMSFIGPEYLVLGVEEFGPLIVALTLAQRVGAGFAAEVATETSEDTLRALSLFGRDPVQLRLAPMACALVGGSLALCLLGLVAWELAGMASLGLRFGVNPFTFFHPEVVTASGVALLCSKALVCGALIFLASARAGLAARAGSDEVGSATTRAVVDAVVACLLASLVLDVVWFLARSVS